MWAESWILGYKVGILVWAESWILGYKVGILDAGLAEVGRQGTWNPNCGTFISISEQVAKNNLILRGWLVSVRLQLDVHWEREQEANGL
jgi:hypothetical protein